MFFIPEASIYIIIAEVSLRVLIVIRVIMRRRPIAVTLAWLVLLFFLPIISIFLYGLIVAHWEKQRETTTAFDRALRHLAKLATRVGGIPPLKGNAVELMDDAALVLDTLIADIDEAEHHCHLLYYIWMPKTRGREVA